MSKKDKIKSLQSLNKIIELTDSNCTVLDIGAGKQEIHANIFRQYGYTVDTVNFFEGSTYIGDFNTVDIKRTYDIVWASHCLEHQLNVNIFLKKIYNVLGKDGYAAITVPPLKNQIVGGHLTLWNAGLLLYNLVLAGFDCSSAKIKKYDYNISVIVQKNNITIPYEQLEYDTNDLNILNKFFPKNICYGKNCVFEGDIEELNW